MTTQKLIEKLEELASRDFKIMGKYAPPSGSDYNEENSYHYGWHAGRRAGFNGAILMLKEIEKQSN